MECPQSKRSVSSSASFALFLGDFGWDVTCHLSIPLRSGRFPFNQNFQKFGNSGKWDRNFPEKFFQKFPKQLNFRNANHSTQTSRNSGSKVKWKENFREKVSENLGIPREVVRLYLEILENAVPPATGSCRVKSYFLVELKAPFNFFYILSLQQVTETEKKIEAR